MPPYVKTNMATKKEEKTQKTWIFVQNEVFDRQKFIKTQKNQRQEVYSTLRTQLSFMKNKLLIFLQSFSKAIRISLLQGIFGYTSQCKHSPTCGDYCVDMVQKHGLFKGLQMGTRRLLTCW